MNRVITNDKTESVKTNKQKTSQQTKVQDQTASQVNSNKHLKKS